MTSLASPGTTARERRIAWLVTAGVFLVYFAWSPFSIRGMGYSEETHAGSVQMLSWLGPGGHTAVAWPRHGFTAPVLQLPWVALERTFAHFGLDTGDLFPALESVTMTALLVGLLCLWLLRLTSPRRAVLMALAAAFTTFLWPYAYIGLEVLQSLAFLATGYLALGSTAPRGWRRALLLALAAAITLSSKGTSILLVPAVGFAVGMYFVRGERRRREVAQMAVLSIVVMLFWVLGAWTRRLSPSFPQLVPYMKAFAVDGVWTVLLNLWSFLVSWNKGLAIFAPLTVIALFLLSRSFASARAETVFAVLALTFLAAGNSVFLFWTDETWGPRYLHAAVCPLLLTLGTVGSGWTLPRRALMGLAAAVGLVVSLLGATVYYGHEFVAAGSIQPITLQALQHDPAWNQPRFNWVLLSIWATGQTVRWPPPDRYWFSAPPGTPPRPTVDLRPFASPQSLVLLPTAWHGSWRGVGLVLAFVTGIGAIAGALRAATRDAEQPTMGRRRSVGAPAPPHLQ